MTCALCAIDPYPPYSRTPRKCSFKSEAFDGDNWACGTMIRLRVLAEDHGSTMRNFWDSSLGILPLPETIDEGEGWLALTWYKNRGCTDTACVIRCSVEGWRPLTLEEAERIIGYYNDKEAQEHSSVEPVVDR